jgi:quercetin dioxygenase-like cupin family protein
MKGILQTLDEHFPKDLHKFQIVKPKKDEHVFLLRDPVSAKKEGMVIRVLKGVPGTVTPVHRHFKTDKMYVADGNGTIYVFTFEHGSFEFDALRNKGDTVKVSAGKWHAVLFSGRGIITSMVVLTTKNDPSDIEWEECADELDGKLVSET